MAVELTGRHYAGPDTGTLPWTCPACGELIDGTPFGTGCPKCGAGQPGKHVGVPPSAPTEDRRAQLHADMQATAAAGVERVAWDPPPVGFTRWLSDFGLTVDTSTQDLLFTAFCAGAQWALAEAAAQHLPTDAPLVPGALGTVTLPRDVAERILAVLLDTVDQPDGQQSTELQGLIAALRETLE